MQLHAYPRPQDDTGIGIHWSAGLPVAVGLDKIRDYWMAEMAAMGVKWVKIANHEGALPFVELLLDRGFMPIVRIHRPAPNPGHMDRQAIAAVEELIQAGARYFEFNNEPDLGSEWQGGQVPPNALDIVAENAIIDMETILERGGMPAVPAVATGSHWDIVGKIVEKGRADLFDGPVWQAVHNYSLNHPLDYPYDSGSQEGAPYTQEFYRALRDEPWDRGAWGGRSLEEVNRERAKHCNPGATVMDDASCWLAYERFDALIRRHIGRSIPVLATENGYVVGEDADPRYPATTPHLHMAQTLEACRIMMGTGQRYRPAPDYYFCTAFWLIGNHVLGSSSPHREGQAWYSERWPDGALPIVRLLKQEPKAARRWQGGEEQSATLRGTVLAAGHRRVVILERMFDQEFREMARADLDAQDRYRFVDLAPGHYRVRLADTTVERTVRVASGRSQVTLDFDLSGAVHEPGRSTVWGRVLGGANAALLLLRLRDGRAWRTMARLDGTFRFVNLPPGEYSVQVTEPPGSRVEGILLSGNNEEEMTLAVSGWGHTVQDAGPGPGFSIIRCSVHGQRNLRVQVRRDGWASREVLTGSKPEHGEFACEIAPLNPGIYTVEVKGLADSRGKPVILSAPVYLQAGRISFVEFVHSRLEVEEPPRDAGIGGRLVNGAGLTVRLSNGQGDRRETMVGEDEVFAFTELGPDTYTLEVVGRLHSAWWGDITLDGTNQVTVEMIVPVTPDSSRET